jgi:Protein of unknown function (DUF3431)
MSTIKLVVSRFKEDLEWLSGISQHCVVYNKGEDDLAASLGFKEVVALDNFGREGESYLRYIISEYSRLPDYVVFSQGQIHDHVRSVSDFKKRITDIHAGTIKIKPLLFTGLNEMRGRNGWGKVSGWRDSSHSGLPIKTIYDILYDVLPPNNSWECNYCGIFMVSREAVMFHSKKFYQVMLDWMNSNEPAAGYIFERMWCFIFRSGIKGRSDIENYVCNVPEKTPAPLKKKAVSPSPATKKPKAVTILKRVEFDVDDDISVHIDTVKAAPKAAPAPAPAPVPASVPDHTPTVCALVPYCENRFVWCKTLMKNRLEETIVENIAQKVCTHEERPFKWKSVFNGRYSRMVKEYVALP